MVRFLLFLLGALTTSAPRQRETAGYLGGPRGASATRTRYASPDGPVASDTVPAQAAPPMDPRAPAGSGWGGREDGRGPHRRRRRIAPWLKWTAAAVVVGAIFRRAIASVALVALSAALHMVGINVHLPHIRFAWPWQSIAAGTTTNTELGPWVLQKIEGISRPALGRANFSFFFTHKVSKNIGPWPCWYASTFYAVGHASATVDLNPGPSWWTPASGHYRLQVLSRPRPGEPGHVTVTMVLPRPQLPQSAHDVTIDNLPSRPIATQHSWTYPGLGCGTIIRPQFPESVLYSEAQQIAFYKSTRVAQITGPLVRSAEAEAVQTIRNNFVQPTVNAFGYTLDQLTVRWTAVP
jgi:hypothetical protein